MTAARMNKRTASNHMGQKKKPAITKMTPRTTAQPTPNEAFVVLLASPEAASPSHRLPSSAQRQCGHTSELLRLSLPHFWQILAVLSTKLGADAGSCGTPVSPMPTSACA